MQSVQSVQTRWRWRWWWWARWWLGLLNCVLLLWPWPPDVADDALELPYLQLPTIVSGRQWPLGQHSMRISIVQRVLCRPTLDSQDLTLGSLEV